MNVCMMHPVLDQSLMGLYSHINQQQTKITIFRLFPLTSFSTAKTKKNNFLAS